MKAVENVSPEELYRVLCNAASQDPALVMTSTNRLKAMMDMFGTFDGLNVIATQKSLPLHVRQQSIIQFKNSALSLWRSRKLLSDGQRVNIRARNLTLLDEQDDIISECNGIIVAKIARQDYPTNWPSLIPDLMSSINMHVQARLSSNVVDPRSTLVLRRSLELLNEVLKEFSTIKLPAGLRTMAQLLEQLHLMLQSHYSSFASNFGTYLTPTTISLTRTAEDVRLAHIIYKCLVKLSVWLWNRLVQHDFKHLEPWLNDLFQKSIVQLQTLYELRMNLILALEPNSADPVSVHSLDFLTRHIRLFGKFFRRMQQLSVPRFVTLPMSNNLILYYWSKVVQATNGPTNLVADHPQAVFPVRYIVQAMVLFKDSLSQWAPIRKDGSENYTVLSQDFVEDAVRLLVTRFIPLNPKDLTAWMADPEEWVNLEDKDNEQWEYELRPCGERVLMTLAAQYKVYVTPLLAQTFKHVIGQPTVNLESIVQKEALYCAIGRCASRLKDVIPFGQWLQQTLVAEAQDPNPNYPIIKRRIAWVIGKWVSEDCASPKNPKIWEVLIYLLQNRGPGTDAVVRLTAAIALRECVDTNDFDADVFGPFLRTAVTELVRMAAEADTLEAKRRVTQSLNAVIERVEMRIVPYIDTIAESIPQLWNASENDVLFKSSLLETITKVIESSKEHSASLGAVIVPLIHESFSDTARLHLDEDGLILWQAALRNSVTIDSVNGAPAVYDLFPIAVSLLSENLDLLGKILSVIESYFLLDAGRILQGHAFNLFQAFVKAIGQANAINVRDMIIALNLLVQLSPAQLWAESMHSSQLFSTLMRTIVEDKASVLLLTEHVYLMARMALMDNQIFLQLMSVTAVAQNTAESTLWEALLNQWWRRFDNMSEPRHRKLVAMGIANLVATGKPEVLERLSTEIFNLWLDVFGEIKEALADISNNASSSPLSSLVTYWQDVETVPIAFLEDTEGTLEFDRRKNVHAQDPVTAEKLTSFVAIRLDEAQVACGGARAFEAYMQKADPTVLKQLQDELTSVQ